MYTRQYARFIYIRLSGARIKTDEKPNLTTMYVTLCFETDNILHELVLYYMKLLCRYNIDLTLVSSSRVGSFYLSLND